MRPSLFTTNQQIILASSSPRRIHFLQELGLNFTSQAAVIDEIPLGNEAADTFAKRMAVNKARSLGHHHAGAFIIGADTIIAMDGEIIGKPENDIQALKTLQKLRGRSHMVLTGLCLHCRKKSLTSAIVKATTISFGSFSDTLLKAYIQTGEPLDKAGAYGLQGKGGFLIEKINGSCSNAIGLPMNELVRLLLFHKVITPRINQ